MFLKKGGKRLILVKENLQNFCYSFNDCHENIDQKVKESPEKNGIEEPCQYICFLLLEYKRFWGFMSNGIYNITTGNNLLYPDCKESILFV